jgi:hypothetical protein
MNSLDLSLLRFPGENSGYSDVNILIKIVIFVIINELERGRIERRC